MKNFPSGKMFSGAIEILIMDLVKDIYFHRFVDRQYLEVKLLRGRLPDAQLLVSY